VSDSGIHSTAAAQDVCEGLTTANHRRQAREVSRKAWQAAPVLAGGALVVAAAARWAMWPVVVPVAALSVGIATLLGYVVFSRRKQAVSDAAASAIDTDANMGGELRSASWFAARDARDEWAEFHLEQAAERVRTIDWAQLYPAIRATRARLATAAMVVGALALSLTIPERVGIDPTAAAATPAAGKAPAELSGNAIMLTPELQRQLDALLAAAESGNLATAEALANNAELRELLNRLSQLQDPALLEALARAMATSADPQKTSAAEDMKSLAERARNAAESAALSKEMKDALEKLADELELVKSDEANDAEGANASATGDQPAAAGKTSAASSAQDLSIQFAKEANPGGGAGVMMMSSQQADQGNGPPGAGVGGSGSQDTAGTATNIEAALKEELVEADQDNPGANVETEIRRKTEQGNATVAFTRGASGKFDRARAVAPPPVPEARRTGVQTYFIRKQ
jgi:hypothetical protein